MIFADELTVDPKLAKSYQKLLKAIAEEKIPVSWYLIARPGSNAFPYNIYPAYLLKEPYYRDLQETVVGVASSKEEAMKLAGAMAVKDLS